MGRVLLCVGRYAENPFYLEAFHRQIYSLEELCYCLFEHAYLLNKEIVNKKLAVWIEEECDCSDLAKELYKFLNTGSSMEAFVLTILEYVGYSSKADIEVVRRLLKSNANLPESEKGKLYADYLLENKRYEKAIVEYKALIGQETDSQMRGKLLHNLGVVYARLFLFDQAAKYFEEAYQLNNEEVSKLHYLAAMRMYLSEQDYILLFADKKENYFISLELEKKVELLTKQLEQEEQILRLEKIIAMKKSNQSAGYYKTIEELVYELKDEYRKEM